MFTNQPHQSSTPGLAFDFFYKSLLKFLSKTNIKTLGNEICRAFIQLLEAQEAALFLKEKDGYKIKSAVNLRKKKIQSIRLSLKSPFVRRLKKVKKSILYKSQGDFSIEEFKILYLKHTLSRLAVDYVVPFKNKSNFLGFLILGKIKSEHFSKQAWLERDKLNLIERLACASIFCLEKAGLKARMASAQDKLREVRQIKDFLWQFFGQGIIFIDYQTGKIISLNQKIKKLFKIEDFNTVNKNTDNLIDKYPQEIFSDFLRCYKDAKILRRSFNKDLFRDQALKLKGQDFILNSIFVRGIVRKRIGDLIIVQRAPAL